VSDDPIVAGQAGWPEYYLRRGLELLDAVPRDDPFWEKTNKKATVYKAADWFRRALEANPGDAEARWILAAIAMNACTQRSWRSWHPWSQRIRPTCGG
jgi:hypothetical protein